MPRAIDHDYVDPLDAVWLDVARRLGLTVRRSAEVYAATDGRGTLTLGEASTLDPDDCLAQMIFHELCHALVQGPASGRTADWGLSNLDDRDVFREHACLRLQATLAGAHGLREVLAPTTDFRSYYDRLPADPVADSPCGRDAEAIRLARSALTRMGEEAIGAEVERGLETTRRLLELLDDAGALDAAPEGGRASLLSRFSRGAGRGRP